MLLKKISAKTVIGDVKALATESDDGARLKLFVLIGRITGIQTGSSNFGDWIAFKGAFEVTNCNTGETSKSPKCFLPEPVQSMLVDALKAHETVDFAVELGIRVDRTLPTGYEYTVEPLAEMQESDELAHLRDLSKQRLALAAPEEPVKAKSKKSA